MPWSVLFFQSSRGDYPVKDFIELIDLDTRAKILDMIFVLNQFGPFTRAPYSKKIFNNLYELRIKGRVLIRIFYTFHKNKIYLLHVFKKKSQKIPSREIKTALDRMKQLI